MSRPRPERMPAVTVPSRPNGLPTAITHSPTLVLEEFSERHGLKLRGRLGRHLQHGDVGLGVAPQDFVDLKLGSIRQDDVDRVAAFDDVVVCHDEAARIDHEAGADGGELPGRSPGRCFGRAGLKSSLDPRLLLLSSPPSLSALHGEGMLVDDGGGNGNDGVTDAICHIGKRRDCGPPQKRRKARSPRRSPLQEKLRQITGGGCVEPSWGLGRKLDPVPRTSNRDAAPYYKVRSNCAPRNIHLARIERN